MIAANRKAKNPRIASAPCATGTAAQYKVQRNPWYPKFFLTIGDWTVRLWNEELKSPIMTSKYFMHYLLDAAWARPPGVFVSTKMDGTLDIWDYFYKQNDPTLSLQVDADGLYQSPCRIVAATSRPGRSTALSTSWSCRRAWCICSRARSRASARCSTASPSARKTWKREQRSCGISPRGGGGGEE